MGTTLFALCATDFEHEDKTYLAHPAGYVPSRFAINNILRLSLPLPVSPRLCLHQRHLRSTP